MLTAWAVAGAAGSEVVGGAPLEHALTTSASSTMKLIRIRDDRIRRTTTSVWPSRAGF
jgi:hypothetical protein